MSAITFGSVCSGIEAASVAFDPLGWRAAWFAEIEAFPCAVLAHHYPDTPNLGDMTTIAARVRAGEVAAPDVLCGGTPCQSFSLAGLRRSLDDARGNLSLAFCELADAIDDVRRAGGLDPCAVLWENVPGVLSTHDNAFGCFLAALAGLDAPLVSPLGWTDAGVVDGPVRAVAWRVLDAQFFGLAQRRRRVFVVASAREGFDPAAVLLEFDGVRRDLAPRREAGQEAAAGAALSVAIRGRDGGGTAELGDEKAGCLRASSGGGDKPHVLAPVAFDGNNQSGPIDVATARNACSSSSGRLDFESETFLEQPAHTLRGEGFDASEDGTGRGTPLVPVAFDSRQDPVSSQHVFGSLGSSSPQAQAVAFAIQAGALRTNPDSGPDGVGVQSDHAYTLEARAEVQCVGHGMQVRRLTPRECERLMGFPDDYTKIPWKRGYWPADKHSPEVRAAVAEQCPDGPRYKALGNSWAVPCVRWIGRRIDAALGPA